MKNVLCVITVIALLMFGVFQFCVDDANAQEYNLNTSCSGSQSLTSVTTFASSTNCSGSVSRLSLLSRLSARRLARRESRSRIITPRASSCSGSMTTVSTSCSGL